MEHRAGNAAGGRQRNVYIDGLAIGREISSSLPAQAGNGGACCDGKRAYKHIGK